MKKSTNHFQPVSTTDDAENDQEAEIMVVTKAYSSVSLRRKLDSTMLLFAVFCIVSLIVAFFVVYFVLSSSQNDVSSTTAASSAHDFVIRNESCFSRHCCKPVDTGNAQQNQHCRNLLLLDCVAESEFCEWRCTDPNDDRDTNNGLPRRHRKFYGISTGISPYVEETEFNTVANSTGPTSVGTFIQMSTMISIDDCGVMYEEQLDYDEAAEEFATLQQLRSDKAFHDRRRMRGSGPSCGGFAGTPCPAGLTCVDDPTDTCDVSTGGRDCPGICVGKTGMDGHHETSSDIQEPIASDGGGLIGSEQSVGCITYETGSGSWAGLQGTSYAYDHICTGTLLAPKWVLTSGHCCHPPGGSNFYSNWHYYPEIKNYKEIYEYQGKGYSGYGNQYHQSYQVKKSYVYSAWQSSGHYDWDFCLMELWNGLYYSSSVSYQYKYAKLDYNIEAYISSSQVQSYNVWNTLGYRWDKYSASVNNGHLLYGWKQKHVQEIQATYFSYSMDAYAGNDYYANGYAGAPIYYGQSGSSSYMKQYCVVSNRYNWKGKGYQYCTRITETTYYDFCGKKYYNGRYQYGQGYGYCNVY
mmetsp:Transcript_37468/g.61582  ORF Transcript_37468/g.61582 Transcript_37468/m.61582 type:complete len:579 (-) Transcript_37468:200-1936(-)